MLPPTRAVLTDLARFTTVAEALTAEREITPMQPRVEIDEDGARLVV